MDDNIKAIIAGKTEYRDTNVRGVDGGFVIAGQRRWIDPTTAQGVFSLGVETVAADASSAAAKVSSFILTGSFENAPTGKAAN